MKKITTIICVLFALVTVLALPVNAATPAYAGIKSAWLRDQKCVSGLVPIP